MQQAVVTALTLAVLAVLVAPAYLLPPHLDVSRRLLQEGCVGIGQDITAGDSPCYDFVNGPSAADNVRIAGLTDQGVAQEVASHPQPPPACCMIARPLLENGCGCNQRFLNLAANFGHPRAEIIAGYRLLKASSCLNSTNGGYIEDPCSMSGPQAV